MKRCASSARFFSKSTVLVEVETQTLVGGTVSTGTVLEAKKAKAERPAIVAIMPAAIRIVRMQVLLMSATPSMARECFVKPAARQLGLFAGQRDISMIVSSSFPGDLNGTWYEAMMIPHIAGILLRDLLHYKVSYRTATNVDEMYNALLSHSEPTVALTLWPPQRQDLAKRTVSAVCARAPHGWQGGRSYDASPHCSCAPQRQWLGGSRERS